MEAIINFSSSQIIFEYIENTCLFKISSDLRHHEITKHSFHPESEKIGNYLDLSSNSKKIFIHMPNSIYHFFIDYAGKILKQASLEKDLELIVPSYAPAESFFDSRIYMETLDLFKSLGIKVTIVDFDKYDGIIINKVYVAPYFNVHQNYEKSLYEAALTLVDNKDVQPFRKVFLSRRYMGDRQHSTSDLPVKHDNRIDSHDRIEHYFRNLGYEIVVPEHFSSLKEQINFFYETKIIVSTTSSGLMNSAFMREGQTMVELQTPLIVYIPRQNQIGTPSDHQALDFANMAAAEQLHYFYIKMAFQKKHKYLAINNLTRESSQIIKTIENDKYLKALLVAEDLEEKPEPKKRKWLRR